jgi:hypothetical protein
MQFAGAVFPQFVFQQSLIRFFGGGFYPRSIVFRNQAKAE